MFKKLGEMTITNEIIVNRKGYYSCCQAQTCVYDLLMRCFFFFITFYLSNDTVGGKPLSWVSRLLAVTAYTIFMYIMYKVLFLTPPIRQNRA